MERTLFSAEHDDFRRAFRSFMDREVKPHQERWREAGQVDREVWKKAGENGFLCPWLPEEHGGPGGEFLHSVIILEELARAHESGFAMSLHSDVTVPYLYEYASDEQKKRWLPGCASGELVTAIAMTEPGAGSDLSGIQTTAVRDGDHYVVNGSKTFITNGRLHDIAVVVVKTDPGAGHRGISLLVMEADTPGYVKGKKLEKMGMASQDTCELSFEDCRIPVSNLLGEEGAGFRYLMSQLQQERLVVAIGAQARAEKILEETIEYTKERHAFGKPISAFQNTQFKLAECATEVEVGRAFLDALTAQHVAGKSLVKECSMSKLWQTEMAGRVIDTCLQLHGGYGYMLEYPVTRAYMDTRVERIFAGTNEVMKLIISRQLGLDRR